MCCWGETYHVGISRTKVRLKSNKSQKDFKLKLDQRIKLTDKNQRTNLGPYSEQGPNPNPTL